MKRVLIYGINFSPELTGIGKYTGEMSEWLASNNFQVKVITSQPYYPEWKIKDGYTNNYSRHSQYNIEITRCPLYIPKKPGSIKRLLHLISFSISSFFPVILSKSWKPDIVIHIVPTLFCAPQSIILSKRAECRSLIHIQDFEVDAFFGLLGKKTFLHKLILRIEKFVLSFYDSISTISEGMINGLINKGHDESKLIFFPNWTDLDHFKNFINRDLLKELGIISNDKKVILYSGNIGKKQGLENLIYAAKILHDHDLVFLIVGDGASKNDLFLLSQKLELNNIHFLPLQPYEDLPLLLSIADCHIVSQKSGPDDAFLPSKLTNIFAVGGNSVITAPENSSLAKLCKDYNGIATLADPDSAKSLAEGILKSIECEKPNRIAEDYANTFLDKDIILKKFIDNIKSKNYES